MSGRRIYFNIRNKLNQILNPGLCLTCGISITSSEFICSHCVDSLELVSAPCSLCGLPNKAEGPVCPACLQHPPRWQKMIAPLVYTGSTRHIIQDLKFNEQLHHANAMLTHIQHYFKNHHVDALIPVPLHQSRLLERGYNQAEEIASNLSRLLNIPVNRSSLKRIKATEAQSGLSLNKRQKNILKAFEFTLQQPYNSVAIIDDIITTGSTMTEICKVMNKAGIKHIQVWSLARALKHD
ncbi:MAG: ComF family protein [Gammaproteobacteria bacterium]|jgi:ComF family protein|nr:ComF family protein [Gammaproteobacteria bacterium]MBT4076910.1 ComF family protein [Gammaproteobacteria bacterium]MBT4861405.1 ComF family protein [Gammaproteobacteria bacterium]MBT6454952.1 ComF family protein [Gammaproteobacteria bacterium]